MLRFRHFESFVFQGIRNVVEDAILCTYITENRLLLFNRTEKSWLRRCMFSAIIFM